MSDINSHTQNEQTKIVLATPEKEKASSFAEVSMGDADKFGVLPDIDNNVPPSDLEQWSLDPSASAQVQEDLATQTRIRELAEKKSRQEIQLRCRALEAKLIAQHAKRKREEPAPAKAASARPNRPNKQTSPAVLMTDLLESQHHAEDELSEREDDAPSSPEEQTAKQPTFYDLNSIVTECAAGRVKPSFQGKVPLTLCVEMCDEEAAQVDNWSREQQKKDFP